MQRKPAKIPPTLLVILDGFGLADEHAQGNAITPETAPHIFGYMKKYPSAELVSHGKDVGLFPGQEGNSEAGHLNIGAGRVVKQDLLIISDAIADGTFFKNEAFEQALFHVKKYRTAVHIMGLLTDEQSAHARPDHLYALLDYFREKKQKRVYLHLFTDGRDAPPHAAVEYLRDLRKRMKNGEQIATIMGRFYAMDRGKQWERTHAAYDALVLGHGRCAGESAEEALAAAYNRGETDEYVCPTVLTQHGLPVARVQDNDAVFFFNARSDRARQLTKAFVQKDFKRLNPNAFARTKYPNNIRFVAMTDFGPDLPDIFTAFPSPDIQNCLARAIGESRRQLFISESEKYAHITYFINGGFAEPINGEDRETVRSHHIYSYATRPQMHIKKLTARVRGVIAKDGYDFVCVNIPNADMVGHTGDFAAAKIAVGAVDSAVHELSQFVLQRGGQTVITADHGNAEEMIDPKTGGIKTAHTVNPVPFIVIRPGADGLKLRKNGRLADVAPTLLKLMGIPKPKEMTGRSLL